MCARAYFALTQVASQLCHRWLPFPSPRGGLPALPDPESLSPSDWAALVAAQRASPSPVLPWLEEYLYRYDRDGSKLVAAVSRYFADLAAGGAVWLCPLDARYPSLLRELADPPAGLSVLGDLGLLDRPMVSVVGSRKASALAMRESFELGKRLASDGIVVVSGGAFGCDIAAHHGVLASGACPAPALGVFAGGLARLYPRANAPVFSRLGERRALFVSERLWGADCRPVDFPTRNRIIAGISGVTAVMQAALRSGALVTARYALQQGRDVAVLAHPPDDVRADGSAHLTTEGAWSFSDAATFRARLRPGAKCLP